MGGSTSKEDAAFNKEWNEQKLFAGPEYTGLPHDIPEDQRLTHAEWDKKYKKHWKWQKGTHPTTQEAFYYNPTTEESKWELEEGDKDTPIDHLKRYVRSKKPKGMAAADFLKTIPGEVRAANVMNRMKFERIGLLPPRGGARKRRKRRRKSRHRTRRRPGKRRRRRRRRTRR